MGDRTAFFYGTLMAPEVLHRVIYGQDQVGHDPAKTILAASLTIVPAILHDFCRHRVRSADYPGIIKEPGHSVKGTFVSGLTDGDIYRLDFFEGTEYTRQWVEVEVLHGPKMRAETYVYTAGEDFLEKVEWDYEDFRRTKLRNWVGASREFDGLDDVAVEVEKEYKKTDGHSEIDDSFVIVNGDEVDAVEEEDDKNILRSVV